MTPSETRGAFRGLAIRFSQLIVMVGPFERDVRDRHDIQNILFFWYFIFGTSLPKRIRCDVWLRERLSAKRHDE